MPLYEYRCGVCETVFEQRRSMSDADADVRCPDGHAKARRLLSVFASARSGGSSSGQPSSAPSPPAGGGCGAHCACH